MITRFELKCERKILYVFFWTNEGHQIVNPVKWSFPWPPMVGYWDGKKFWADVDYDEDTKELIFNCSDNDVLTVMIDTKTRIVEGTEFQFKSVASGIFTFKVTESEIL